MKDLIEQWASEHAKKIYEEECDSHSECSEKSGFIAGAEAMNQWWAERFKILLRDSPREIGALTAGFFTHYLKREKAREELIKAAGEE